MTDWIGFASLALSLLMAACGGVWALLLFYFKQKRQFEDLRSAHINQSIKTLGDHMEDMGETMVEWRNQLEGRINQLHTDIEVLKAVQKNHIEEMKRIGDGMTKIYRHFAGEAAKSGTSETVQLAKDTFLIRNKKPGDKP